MSSDTLNHISKEFLYSKVVHIKKEQPAISHLQIDIEDFYTQSQNIQKHSITEISLHDCMMHVDNPSALIEKSRDLLSEKGCLSFYVNIYDRKKWFNKWLFKKRKEKLMELDEITSILEKNAFIIDKNFVFNDYSPSKVYFEISKIDNNDLNN